MNPETVSNNPTRVWLPIPAKQVIYALSTDYYPWGEVWEDLSLRRDFTGVLEARSTTRRAQALWIAGEFLGAYGRTDKTLEQFSQSFPRAFLLLYEADPSVIRTAWEQRVHTPQALPQPWPEVASYLTSGGLSGALFGGPQGQTVSYWQAGKPIAGSPPPVGPVTVLGQLTPLTASALTEFWNEVLSYTARQEPAILRAWESSAKALVNRHPCLDPFIHEVWLEKGRIQVAGTEVPELKPALLEVFLAAAKSVKFPVTTLQTSSLGTHPLWKAAGLGAGEQA